MAIRMNFSQKNANVGFYLNKMLKIWPKARWIIRSKMANYSGAGWISELFLLATTSTSWKVIVAQLYTIFAVI
jgi:hypothetical protein